MEAVHLHGSEEVSEAARSMRTAAAEMNRAAANFEDTCLRYTRVLTDLVERVEAVAERSVTDAS